MRVWRRAQSIWSVLSLWRHIGWQNQTQVYKRKVNNDSKDLYIAIATCQTCKCTDSMLTRILWGRDLIVPILQVRRLRHKAVRGLAQVYTGDANSHHMLIHITRKLLPPGKNVHSAPNCVMIKNNCFKVNCLGPCCFSIFVLSLNNATNICWIHTMHHALRRIGGYKTLKNPHLPERTFWGRAIDK